MERRARKVGKIPKGFVPIDCKSVLVEPVKGEGGSPFKVFFLNTADILIRLSGASAYPT
jgi:hypothetical protein